MIQFDKVQRLPLKIILAVLVSLQIIVLILGQHLDLDQYVSITVILLTFPIAYFAYRYFELESKPVKTYQAVQSVSTTDYTNNQIAKLQASQEYKKYLQKKQAKQLQGLSEQQNLDEEQLKRNQQIQQIFKELQQKQTEIFDS